jgi:hypothetical protein
MTATDQTWFANVGVLTVSTGTPVTVAVVKDIEINVTAEHVPIYGFGNPTRVDVKRHSFKVPVKIKFAKFAPTVSTWWAFWILNPGVGDGTMATNNNVQMFTLTATFTSSDGLQTLKGTVSNLYFEDLPIKASEGQWITVDLKGEGATVAWTNS